MIDRPHNVLFQCKGNSPRNILAEPLFHQYVRATIRGSSVWSHPRVLSTRLRCHCRTVWNLKSLLFVLSQETRLLTNLQRPKASAISQDI